MRGYSTGWAKKGMFIGAVPGFVAFSAVAYFRWDVRKSFYYEYLVIWRKDDAAVIPFITVFVGAVLGAFVGGIAGACLDWLADRGRGQD